MVAAAAAAIAAAPSAPSADPLIIQGSGGGLHQVCSLKKIFCIPQLTNLWWMSNSEGLPQEQGHLDDSNNNTITIMCNSRRRTERKMCVYWSARQAYQFFCYQEEKLGVDCIRSTTISYYIARLITLVIWWRRRRSRRNFRRGWRPPWSPLTSDPHRSWTMLWPRAHSALLKVRAMTWNIKKTRWISGYFGPNIKYNLDYTMAFDTWLSATKSANNAWI